ncbi:MAG: MMPL family transporter [Candidatus Krumholzibacteria bacterium]|nr:MMPL family transporter [Candidatus Krumholzibacteria bacterium]MDH4338255.1 MMPL family transporter [Candidatus Krumholzibacteria bacterium]MDH5271053.1 MMPL family transporter [Candidatus Krumholzibacteria bacterium]MDH5626879.1 MMPL family transporter [Candidatus Krumholzibacteria bacterium]
MKRIFPGFPIRHPKLVLTIIGLITVVAALQLPRIQIDTDPENMLPADEPVRVIHKNVEAAFNLNDFLVLGVVVDEGTVFTPAILQRVQKITDAVRDMDGVIADDILAPSEVDDILPDEGGGIRVQTLMESVPDNDEDARQILVQIRENPILRGKLASDDGKAIALFIPLESKDVAMEVGEQIQSVIEQDRGDEQYYLAGLPVAQDTFGAAMFQQMAVSAPMAFLLIFLLMLFFFRRWKVVLAPMILSMITVIWTMGLLIGMGFTVHIMSSMIPIFLIPIAVLNSIHILSSVHANYHQKAGMEETLYHSMRELFLPMLFTSLTTVVGFASLIMTPIPPVQVFGAFVAFGVFVAWLLSLLFIPAYAMLMPPSVLEKFGTTHEGEAAPETYLHKIRHFAVRRRALVVTTLSIVMVIAGYGVTRIVVNDNPVNWFKPGSPLRVADQVMNEHLPGTYIAYVELAGSEDQAFLEPEWMGWAERLQNEIGRQDNVGAASSVVDVLKKVQYELLNREPGSATLADSREKIAQYLFLYEMSGGSPDDLFKFITPGQDRINIWVQMRKGDNQQVRAVVDGVNAWIAQNPPPAGLEVQWAGLSYINVKWQQLMVSGMGKALAGSWVVVLIMMVILFRSLRMGLLAMVPLTATIVITYGWVGLTGRNYDMPIAVLSSLSLGLSVDFAIHFLQRTRDIHRHHNGNFNATMNTFFHEPAQALARNIVVIALGFVPMFFATLVPYVTVGAFFFAIMLISGGATFLIMPAVLSYFPARVISGYRHHPAGTGSLNEAAAAARR